jgi:hypothetical protein
MVETTVTGDRRRPAAREVLWATAAALVVLGLCGAGADRSHEVTRERRAAADDAALGPVLVGTAADIERGLRSLVAAAATVSPDAPGAATGPAALASVPGASSLGFVAREGDPSLAAGAPILSDAERDDPELAAVLDRASASGEPQLSPPVELGEGVRSLLVAPVYGTDASTGVPGTASERRAASSGWIVAVVDLGDLAVSHAPAGARVRVADHGVTLATAGPDAGPLAERTLVIDGRSLEVAAGVPDGSGLEAATVWFLVAGGVLGPVAAAVVLLAAARLRSQRATAERQGAQVRLIGEVAPLVQQSLDLSEVLPAVAVQLSDHFGLAGVSLSTGSRHGGQTELFSIGARPSQPANPLLQPPEALGAGETLTLALQRGGRSVALLQVVAGRSLDGSELESLRALTELVAAAMVNASLYASQQEALQRLRELDGLKTVFLGTASHELRTPATAIAGFASLLSDSWERFGDEQRRDFAGRIAANARSLSAVVQDLLDFSLLDRGGLSVNLEAIDLGALVESVVDRLGPALGDRVITCSTAPSPAVMGDRNGLERVATNLLTNAVKFSPAGSTITVAVEPAGEGAALIVSDEGPGVPPEEREQVFTRFYRGSGEAVVQTRGVGIGLSLVAEFTARMHGEVTVDDAPGGGARFTVRLPAASLADQED